MLYAFICFTKIILADQTVLRLSTPQDILAEVKAEEDKEADDTIDVPPSVSKETLQLMDEMNCKSKPKQIPTEVSRLASTLKPLCFIV